MIDNASTDGSAEMVKSDFPQIKLIQPGKNLGYAAGNNLGFQHSSGEFILTLNPDTELNSSSLEIPLDILARDDSVGCVGIKLKGLDGKTQNSVRGFPSVAGITGDLLRIRLGPFDSYRLSKFDYETEQTAPQPMGTFLMFRRTALAKIGDPSHPFDPAFPIFFNEVDLLFRLSNAGFNCVYTPRASVLHHGGESTKQVRPQMIWESHRSLIRYWKKHAKTPIQKATFAIMTPLVYLGALIRAKGVHAGFRA